MKWKHVCCVILLGFLILQVTPVVGATGSTEVSGTVPLVTYEVSVSNIGRFSATISWKTNGNATSQVFYDITFHEDIADYAYSTSKDTALVTEHSVYLTGLSPLTTYHYRVKSVAVVDSTEFTAISEDYTFTTSATDLTPMSRFEIDHAKIEFEKQHNDDRAHVKGELELDLINGNGVDISELVTVTLGLLSETITMVEKEDEKWRYRRPGDYDGVINYMTINWNNGEFEIRMDKADFSGVTNPVTISIRIGDDIGEETIVMRETENFWDYNAPRQWSWWEWWRWWRWWR